jgi:hypothetical protein
MAKRIAMIEMAPALGRNAGAISDVRSGRLGGGIAGQALFKTCWTHTQSLFRCRDVVRFLAPASDGV